MKLRYSIDPRVWAVLVSLGLSFFLGWNFYINNDGILYLKTAEAILHQTTLPVAGAKWPFYPILIASLSYITGLTVQTSALVLQALFFALLIVGFINIVRALGGSLLIQHLAGLVILLHPELNEARNLIIRDFGYWAFLLCSFYYLLCYLDRPSWFNIFMWILCIVMATLFRIEGIVIAAFSPLLLFLSQHSIKKKFIDVLRFYVMIVVLVIFALGIIIWRENEISWAALGRVAELPKWWQYLSENLFLHWASIREGIHQLFPIMKNSHVNIFMLGGLILYVSYLIITTLGIFFSVVVGFGQVNHCLNSINTSKRRLLYGFLLLNVAIVWVFVSYQWFLSSRYLIATSLILLLWTPFTLAYIYEKWGKNKLWQGLKRLLVILIVLALFMECYVSFGPSTGFVKESANWIRNNTPENAMLYSNNAPLAYYADRPGTDWRYIHQPIMPLEKVLMPKELEKYQYMALYVGRYNKDLNARISKVFKQTPLAEFSNRHGDKVIIFQVKSHEQS